MNDKQWYKDMQTFHFPTVQRTWLDDLCLYGREMVAMGVLFLSMGIIGLVALILFGQ
jgi:hypothetical protein